MKLYDADFYRWTQETAGALRRGDLSSIDVFALIEEVEDLGKRERAALESRLAILIGHLLKWDFQPAKHSKSWQATIELQRTRIARLVRQSPSLQPYLLDVLPDSYSEAVLLAVRETGQDKSTFPASCPYTLDEILSERTIDLDR